MSVTEYDVIIIGAGVAGLTAGAFLAGRGFKVALVTTGEPTACLSTGCIDVCSRDHNPLCGIKESSAGASLSPCSRKNDQGVVE